MLVSRFAHAATVRDILLRDGVRGLYRGLGPTMLGYLPTWAIYFTVYDGVKGWLGQPPTGYDGTVGPCQLTVFL